MTQYRPKIGVSYSRLSQGGLYPKDIPATGKMIYTENPILIKDEDFQDIVNCRYKDYSIVNIKGSTTTNSYNGTFLSGIYIKRTYPDEKITAFITSNNNSSTFYRIDNDIPNQGNTIQICTLEGNNHTIVKGLSNYSVIVGTNTLVYGGNLCQISAVINTDNDGSFIRDYSSRLKNFEDDETQCAVIYSGQTTIGNNTVGLYHFDYSYKDESPYSHNATGNNTVFSNSIVRFGTYSVYFPHLSGAVLTIPNSNEITTDTSFFFEAWIYPEYEMDFPQTIYHQNDGNSNNSILFCIETNNKLGLHIFENNTLKYSMKSSSYVVINAWNYVSFGINYGTAYLFLNGNLENTGTFQCPKYTSSIKIGTSLYNFNNSTDSYTFIGYLDEVRISNICLHTTSYSIPISPFPSNNTATEPVIYVGTIFPTSGEYFYFKQPNTQNNTFIVETWNGSGWVNISYNDNTNGFKQNGLVSYNSTANIAKPKMLFDRMLYWRKYTISKLSTNTKLYNISCSIPVQQIKNIWDGSLLQVAQFIREVDGVQINETSNVLKEDAVSVYTYPNYTYAPETYTDLSNFKTSNIIYIAFLYRIVGLYIKLIPETYNKNISSIKIQRYNGNEWVDVEFIDDQTTNPYQFKTLARSGYILFDDCGDENEYQTSVNSDMLFNYYKITFSNQLSDNIKIDFIGGVKAPQRIGNYKLAITWLNSLWLLNEYKAYKNKIVSSAPDNIAVWNTEDCGYYYIGDNSDITACCTLFSRYGAEITEALIVCKENETWYLYGQRPAEVTRYCISKTVGCIAPKTMQVCDIGIQIVEGINKSVAIWLSNSGIVMFDNSVIQNIDRDIEVIFKSETFPLRINKNKIKESIGFYDIHNKEYHFVYPSYDSEVNNIELVYDLIRHKWYRVERPYSINGVFNVYSNNGRFYNVAGCNDSKLRVLEYGHKFDNIPINTYIRLSDRPPYLSSMYQTEIRHFKAIFKNSNINITAKHYKDCSNNSVTIFNFNTNSPTVVQSKKSVILQATFHGFSYSSSVELNDSFEYLATAYLYRIIREDTEGV